MISNEMPGFNFDLGETADLLRGSFSACTFNEIAPRASEIEAANDFPQDLWRKLGELSLIHI